MGFLPKQSDNGEIRHSLMGLHSPSSLDKTSIAVNTQRNKTDLQWICQDLFFYFLFCIIPLSSCEIHLRNSCILPVLSNMKGNV